MSTNRRAKSHGKNDIILVDNIENIKHIHANFLKIYFSTIFPTLI